MKNRLVKQRLKQGTVIFMIDSENSLGFCVFLVNVQNTEKVLLTTCVDLIRVITY